MLQLYIIRYHYTLTTPFTPYLCAWSISRNYQCPSATRPNVIKEMAIHVGKKSSFNRYCIRPLKPALFTGTGGSQHVSECWMTLQISVWGDPLPLLSLLIRLYATGIAGEVCIRQRSRCCDRQLYSTQRSSVFSARSRSCAIAECVQGANS